MFTVYQNREEYDKAIEVLDRISAAYAGVQGLPEWVNMQKSQTQARLALQRSAHQDTAAKK
jgi:hypothetical protein